MRIEGKKLPDDYQDYAEVDRVKAAIRVMGMVNPHCHRGEGDKHTLIFDADDPTLHLKTTLSDITSNAVCGMMRAR